MSLISGAVLMFSAQFFDPETVRGLRKLGYSASYRKNFVSGVVLATLGILGFMSACDNPFTFEAFAKASSLLSIACLMTYFIRPKENKENKKGD